MPTRGADSSCSRSILARLREPLSDVEAMGVPLSTVADSSSEESDLDRFPLLLAVLCDEEPGCTGLGTG